MRIFVSWSGSDSRQVAELLRSWMPSVLQEVDLYVSSQDIAKGERWAANVGSQLAEIDFGIVVVTRNNLSAPWILFEAGALSKSVKALLVPLLCGIESIEAATSPLTQFQYARVTEDDMRELVRQINARCQRPLDGERLDKVFSKWWPDFADQYAAIDLSEAKPAKKETDGARLGKIEDAIGELMLEMRRLRRSVPPQAAGREYVLRSPTDAQQVLRADSDWLTVRERQEDGTLVRRRVLRSHLIPTPDPSPPAEDGDQENR